MKQNLLSQHIYFTSMHSTTHERDRYVSFTFTVTEDIFKITIELFFDAKEKTQLPIAIFDPEDALRGIKVSEHVQGEARESLWIAVDQADKGCIPGPIPKGIWKVTVYKRYLRHDISCRLKVSGYKDQNARSVWQKPSRQELILDPREKWYCGEIHMHSDESTGRTSVAEIITSAKNAKLHFIAITDHFTIAHWHQIDKQANSEPPLLMHSCELSGEYGHANLHGIQTWISPFVDGCKDYSMNQVADTVHKEHGLFCINHPLSARVGWRYRDFDMTKADAIEVVGLPDGTNSFLYPVLWDRLLCTGQHLTGVGSSDSHDPNSDGPWKLGVLRTWVYAENLGEKAIIKGIKSGRVHVTRGDVRVDFFALLGYPDNEQFKRFETGDDIETSSGTTITFVVSLKNHKKGYLYVISDGLIYDVFNVLGTEELSSDWEEILFTVKTEMVKKGSLSYFRVEFHEEIIQPYYEGMSHRDHNSLMALTNPIWIKRAKNPR